MKIRRIKMSLSSFPKKVGCIFVEKYNQEKTLDFEQSACAFFLLQMNKHQSTFEFQIINPYHNAPESNEDLEAWFIKEIKNFKGYRHDNNYIDYWIAITSVPFYQREGWYFYKVNENTSNLEKYMWLITSHNWETNMSPPSLFEFFAISVYTCALECLGLEFSNEIYDHEIEQDYHLSRGCIFDYTMNVSHRRILISNPELCSLCKSKLKILEKNISTKINKPYHLTKNIEKILNRKWMGTLDEIDSPFYNLKKMYKYDIERNSGYSKTRIEKFRDNITDNFPQWIVGGIIGVGMTVLGTLLARIFNIG